MPDNLYRGIRRPDTGLVEVTKNGQVLQPLRSLKVRNHSPTGFEWGYGGSGPAQLALAILLEETSREEAEDAYQDFKWEHVGHFPKWGWSISSAAIRAWLDTRFITLAPSPDASLRASGEVLDDPAATPTLPITVERAQPAAPAR
jgi:hypothetical protein